MTQYVCAFTGTAPVRQPSILRHRRSALSAIVRSPQEFNEFSRKISTETILGGRQYRRSNYRDYRIELEASETERQALAKRFQLEALASLKASLLMRPAYAGEGDIHVEGSMQASLTQRCVRTNDLFDVVVEYPIGTVVRPVWPDRTLFPAYDEDKPKNKKRKQSKKGARMGSRSIEDLDVAELQRLVDEDMLYDENDVIEDEAILAAGGMLDAGELVSQLFCLSLDPYPKKPGSEFTPKRFTG